MTTLSATVTTLMRNYVEETMRVAYILSFTFLIISMAKRPDMVVSVLALCAGFACAIIAMMSAHELATQDYDAKPTFAQAHWQR